MVVNGLAISRYAVGTDAYPKTPHVKQHGGPRYAAAIGTCHMQGTPRSSGLHIGMLSFTRGQKTCLAWVSSATEPRGLELPLGLEFPQ